MQGTGGGDAPFWSEEICFTVIEIIGQESADGVNGGVDSSARAGTYGRTAAGISLSGLPKKRCLDAQREHHGSYRKEMMYIQRDILAEAWLTLKNSS